MSSKNRRKKPPQVRHPARARRASTRKPASTQDRSAATGPLSQFPQPLFARETPQVCEGRLYLATSTLRLSGEVIDFDFAAALHALAEGKLTGEAADVAGEAVTAFLEEAALPLPGLDGSSLPALLDSTRRLIADGFLGTDINGGYLTVPSLSSLSR
ncbi:hypothetical protein [Streptomyces jumonjinensis]|uniref:Uncharacterized protein n=1 Tax=Streptomyces jumonjinensis TaxID=1945 RepID=A0A646KLF2_STRJU|nr:hypothetical protein [Streptomyces jumonjinensis]MQT02771.1 hypothetical protein [Streptomyces jumonjinensis]